ncbi:MAG: hypothetical protein JNN04_17285 [Cyclobacteriaceae bacterium]|nr:hypothetical protein [Cyclobacteriaceae bacterium]
MDSTDNSTPGPAPDVKMELNREALRSLYEAGGWATFLAILGFIMMGFLLIAGIFMGAIFSNLPNSEALPFPAELFTVFYLLIAVVYFFPIYYLFKFANLARSGIQQRDSSRLSSSIQYLKSHYKFVGILTIVGIAMYLLFILLFVALGMGKMLGDTMNA